ncbi:MAG: 3-hydroxyacyl-CoA dehydrogenase NAD-binding domain-containing protein [Acidobacteria bacterium]|nr:3-hydroxyacyl-CoA dehydrogenase NAD-binding domain-containing protein [Acidobacteriota bacterium]
MLRIQRVAVLGAGVMGARIAAHLANAGLAPILLDIVPRELTAEEAKRGLGLDHPAVRNRIARAGLESARRSDPAAFFLPDYAERVRVGNFEDNLGWLAEADWIIEAVAEKLEIKRALLERVEAVRRPGSVVSSNTSGLPLALIAEGRSETFRQHWLGTHFFNPPRYMRLVEVIPVRETLPAVVEAIAAFCDLRLGKVVVRAKDTPNFIANRIGTFSVLNTLRLLEEQDLSLEAVDELTGPVIGLPRSATFRTIDIVGLDVFSHVVSNLRETLPNDDRRDLFQLPAFVHKMLERGWLGDKSGQGFYKRVKEGGESKILALDWKTLEYRPRQKPSLYALEMARGLDDPGERLRTLLGSRDRIGAFYQKLLAELFHYSASRLPEIADTIVEVDRAMRYGFNWERGPFELWDAVGVETIAERWKQEQRALPPLVERLLQARERRFYIRQGNQPFHFDLERGRHMFIPDRPGVLVLPERKAVEGAVVRSNAGASLIDLGDGVACLEFHTKMNAIGGDILEIARAALDEVQKNFDGLVVGNQGTHFSAGANIMLLLVAAQEGEWDEIDAMVRAFQDTFMAFKYAPRPVVVAPHGMTLGGGCEVVLHGARVVAAAETYMGQVETGAGLIPAGGGCKELALRAADAATDELDLLARMRHIFETVALGKVSTSADDARRLGFLRPGDQITMNLDRLLGDAKRAALSLWRTGYRPGTPRNDLRVAGEPAYTQMKLGIHLLRRAERISDYDAVIGEKLAYVLSGGALNPPQAVSEQYMLDLEREAFVSLCGERKTQERIQYILKTGKPLRN